MNHDTVRISRLRAALSRDGGFTMMETLIVLGIVGLLLAIITPQVKGWRERSYMTSVKTDSRNLAFAIDAYRLLNDTYPTTAQITSGTTVFDNFKLSNGNTVYGYGAVGNSYAVAIIHGTGTGQWATYDSSMGGMCKSARTGTPQNC